MKENPGRETLNYDIFPMIVPAGQKSKITVTPLYGHSVKFSEKMRLFHRESESLGKEGFSELKFSVSEGCLSVETEFTGEQEHTLLLKDEPGEKILCDFRVYSLEPDLLRLFPWKGDFHLHSDRSDGREEPAYVAASGRKIGMDFLALTDHRKYEPSLEAAEKFRDSGSDLKIYPGEEVHPPENPVHIVNFGGNFSLGKIFETDKERHLKETEEIRARLKNPPSGENARRAASSEWCFRKIDEGGGIGIFCHPYWFTGARYDVSPELSDYIMGNCSMTAVELVGGYHKWQPSNNLQTVWFSGLPGAGKIPVLGASDAHGCERDELFGWYWSIVFSESAELPDLKRNIQGMKSVAVEMMKNEVPRVYGPFRLVKYSLFLMREYFPRHDRLCAAEGEMMLRLLAGDEKAGKILRELSGGVSDLLGRLWGLK
jgi:hypothetical protein